MKTFLPKPYKKVIFSVRVQEDKLEHIGKIATAHNMSRNQFINQCIDFAIQNMPRWSLGYQDASNHWEEDKTEE
jgi:hypothetical protein